MVSEFPTQPRAVGVEFSVLCAQLWILAATVEGALARRFSALLPLVIASGICFALTLTREWVLTEEGRASRIGFELNCKRCDEGDEAYRIP